MDWGLPTILVLNMMDEVKKNNQFVDVRYLKSRLDIEAIIPVSAKYGDGIDSLISTIQDIVLKPTDKLKITNYISFEDKYNDL
jgi:Fe2+ transport system protein B